ncbi:hypothetical protein [Sphingomonas ginkgonis]|uniref:hypothetical protein n=1 Tax=Sphingomonas ginkgonis TaxID=2315330 RepID=UPI00163A841F|nr:hypothetical protein [Sphingomonas ginkgonis]
MGANTRLDSLSDLVRRKANLRVECHTCDKVSVIDAARFNRFCLVRQWSTQLGQLGTRLRCARCGARPGRLGATPEKPEPDLFPQGERAWKALYRRMRG